MKFILDTEDFKNTDIGISGCLYLLSLYFKEPITSKTYNKVAGKGFTYVKSFENGEPMDMVVAPDGMNAAEDLLTKHIIKEEPKEKVDRFKELAKQIREIYPKGKKPGTNYQWRDSAELIATRLRILVIKYNVEFTDEEAIEATKNYVQGFNGDYRYMALLKYFIFKNTNDGVCINQNSPLLSCIDEIREGGGNTDYNNNWTAEIR